MTDTLGKITVSLGIANVGANRASIKVKLDRAAAPLAALVKTFVGSRLHVTVEPEKDPKQPYFAGLEPEPFVAQVECGKVSVGTYEYGFTLSFEKKDAPDLIRVAGADAVMTAKRLGQATGDVAGQMTLGGEGE